MKLFYYRAEYKTLFFSFSLLGLLGTILGKNALHRGIGAAFALICLIFTLHSLFTVIIISEDGIRQKTWLQDKKTHWNNIKDVKETVYSCEKYRAIRINTIRIDCRIQNSDALIALIQKYCPAMVNGDGVWRNVPRGIDLRLILLCVGIVWMYLVFALFLGL